MISTTERGEIGKATASLPSSPEKVVYTATAIVAVLSVVKAWHSSGKALSGI